MEGREIMRTGIEMRPRWVARYYEDASSMEVKEWRCLAWTRTDALNRYQEWEAFRGEMFQLISMDKEAHDE